jgi:hypothetical protein
LGLFVWVGRAPGGARDPLMFIAHEPMSEPNLY